MAATGERCEMYRPVHRMGCELKVVYWLQMGEGKLGGGVDVLLGQRPE